MRDLDGWLPIRFIFTSSSISVRWIQFGSIPLDEPFFQQTVRKLKSSTPPALELDTNLSTFLNVAQRLPEITPAGIILHVSRCGSTLLANVLRLGNNVQVLSEAAIIGMLFRPKTLRSSPFLPDDLTEARKLLLNAALKIYARHAFVQNTKLVIKAHAINILQIPVLRSVWPQVPIVILIREPVEVALSNLKKPAGWLRALRGAKRKPQVPYSVALSQTRTVEESCARGLGNFYSAALRDMDRCCQILDYSDLDTNHFYKISRFFSIDFDESNYAMFERVRGIYAKDVLQQLVFEDDRVRKQEEASDAIRQAVERWARVPYELLKFSQTW